MPGMRLVPTLTWSVGGMQRTSLHPQLFELLSLIDGLGSLRAAADEIRMPYRTAWGLLREMEDTFGRPLVQLRWRSLLQGPGRSWRKEGWSA